MKKVGTFLILISIVLNFSKINAQDDESISSNAMRIPKASYKLDEQSKTALCYAGKNYEYIIKIEKDMEYNFSFFASSVFNNQINFKLINNRTSEILINLPGASSDKNQMSLLEEYYDNKLKKMVHPSFDVNSKKGAELKLIIDILPVENYTALLYNTFQTNSNPAKGYVTVFIQSKPAEIKGF